MPRYSWIKRNAGPTPRGPNPPGVNTGTVGRPVTSATFVPPGGGVTGGGGPLLPPKGTGGIRPPDPINDVTSPPWWLGPPVREGGGGVGGVRETKPPRLIGPGPTPVDRGGGYLGPPLPPDKMRFTGPPLSDQQDQYPGDGERRFARPPVIGPGPDEWDRPKRLPPAQIPPVTPPDDPGWTPWDDAGGGPGGDPPPPPPLWTPPNKTGLPRNPGDNDFPPRETSFGAMETPEQAKRRFGMWPGSSDPAAPQPPVIPGQVSYNPFTGKFS